MKLKKPRNILRKKPPPSVNDVEVDKRSNRQFSMDSQATLRNNSEASQAIDKQTGERKDHTLMLHSLVHSESFDEADEVHRESLDTRPPGDDMIASVPQDIWMLIADYLTPAETANLAFSGKAFADYLADRAWNALDQPENYQYRTKFLLPMDQYLPNHLFCFPCAKYHLRTQKGREVLKTTSTPNPVFNCPNANSNLLPQPRTRLTPGRMIPFPFIQLAMRRHRYGRDYGIDPDLMGRLWKQGDWTHASRFQIINNHMYLRCVSTTFAMPNMTPAGLRMLLYSREDYTPYFSICAHWQDGELMKVCKCAISHIPERRFDGGVEGLGNRVKDRWHGNKYNPLEMVTLCSRCQPMRRCPECPTEYLVEIRLAEDTTDNTFKRAISVTRWSDLGDGISPLSPEWAACNGLSPPGSYDSFAMTGKRAISGTFEAKSTEEHIPTARMLNLNPKMRKEGEEGDGWY